MRRGQNSSDQSLDLLLDTICNTFGGVLFISLLVVILLNLTSKQVTLTPPEEPARVELVDTHRKYKAQQRKLERLRQAVKELEELRDKIAPEKLKQLVADLVRLRQQREQMLEQKENALDQAANAQNQINDIAKQLQELRDSIAKANQELAVIERKLQAEVDKRSRDLKLPKAHRTAKREVALFLKNGRLCAYARVNANGDLVRSEAECADRRDQKGPYVEPNAAAGTPVDSRGRNTTALERKIKSYDRERFYLAVFVWPDSFDHFPVVRDIMVDNNYEYRLVPFPEGEHIYVGAAGASGVDVQGGG